MNSILLYRPLCIWEWYKSVSPKDGSPGVCVLGMEISVYLLWCAHLPPWPYSIECVIICYHRCNNFDLDCL